MEEYTYKIVEGRIASRRQVRHDNGRRDGRKVVISEVKLGGVV